MPDFSHLNTDDRFLAGRRRTEAHREDLFEATDALLLRLLDDCTKLIHVKPDVVHANHADHFFLPAALFICGAWHVVIVVVDIRAESPAFRNEPPRPQRLLEVHDDELCCHQRQHASSSPNVGLVVQEVAMIDFEIEWQERLKGHEADS
jgi:hypothetical protein